jgi:hypothetical protein
LALPLVGSWSKGAPLLAALKYTESSTISSPTDYTNPDVIVQVAALFASPTPLA